MTSEYDEHGFLLNDDQDEIELSYFHQAEINQSNYNDQNSKLKLNDEHQLPEHACKYCAQSNPLCVGQCNICKNWFCNGSTESGGASHLIRHLVKSRHKEVVLHKESPLDGIVLECYNCGLKNVFTLGFVPAKNESVVLLLCRNSCAYQHASRELGCNFEEWEPIISDKKFINWLIKIPVEEDMMNIRNINLSEIAKIDDSLKVESKNVEFIESQKTKLVYNDPMEYQNTYIPLIQLEEDYDRVLKEGQIQKNITIRTEVTINKKRIVYFVLPPSDSDIRLMTGDEVQLTNELCDKKPLKGNVIKIPNNFGEEVGVELKFGFSLPDVLHSWNIEFVWKPITFDRMKNAFKSFNFNESNMNEHIRKKVLGLTTEDETIKLVLPKRYSAPGLPELNHTQVRAIMVALQRPFSLIQGPPGTGKTVTSATLVYHVVKQFGGKVLVCAPSNIAVDQLADKINRTGLKVVRVCAKSREAVDSSVSHLTLHNQVNYIETIPEFASLRNLKRDQGELTENDAKKYNKLRDVMERKLIEEAEVVCATCIGAGDPRFRNMYFRCVLLDESTQATEPECLVPIVRCVKQLILVGDHCQLGPVIMCKKAAAAGLSHSLFERLIDIGAKPLRLQIQYRMHPCLSEFSSCIFYEGFLQNGVTDSERLHPAIDFPWPQPEKPQFFYCAYGREEISSSGTSFLNRTECAAVESFATRLLKSGIRPQQIGIITPYEGQRAYLVSFMQHCGHLPCSIYQNIEVASVDAFQGREKDYIIMSCVRSNDHHGIGFLNDSRRLNVALTRAKFGFIIVGNPKVLCKNELWASLLHYYKDKNLLVEGYINNLRPAQIILNKPLKPLVLPKVIDTSVIDKCEDLGLSQSEKKVVDEINDASKDVQLQQDIFQDIMSFAQMFADQVTPTDGLDNATRIQQ